MTEQPAKRKFKRIGANWIVRFRTRQLSETMRVQINEKIRNVSLGGVFIETRFPFPSGAFVEFDFNVPGQTEPIHAKGVVRWVNDGSDVEQPVGMGIEFVEVSTRGTEAIRTYVETQVADVLKPLVCTEEHQSLLRLYAMRVGETMKLETLGQLLQMDHARLIQVLSDFALYGLATFTADEVTFSPSSDANKAQAIRDWAGGDAGVKNPPSS